MNNKTIENDLLEKVSSLFKIVSDPTRIKILYLLKNNKLSVNEIYTELKMSQSAVSHQLKVLKEYNLVKFERSGKNINYTLSDEHVYNILNQTINHINEEKN